MRSTRGVPRIRVIFSRKSAERVCQFFTKIPERAIISVKKFQIGSVILMAQMTNQKKTELIDYFHLVWERPFFPKTSLKIVFWRPPLGTKIPKKVILFRKKFQKLST